MEVKQIDWFDDHFYKIRYENEAKVEIEDYIPSVTTKLGALAKPFLMGWYGDIGTREARMRTSEQADRGSRIHWAWECYTTGGVVIYDPIKTPVYTKEEIDEIIKKNNNNYFIIRDQNEMYQVMKLEKFYKALNPLSCISETIVYDIENRNAGTMDNMFSIREGEYEINGSVPLRLGEGFYIFDLKSGNYLGKEARMQVACYSKCAVAMGLVDEVQGALIGHTASNTKKGIEGFSTIHLTQDDIEQEYQDYTDIAKVWERNFGNKKPTIRQIPGIIKL